MALSTIVGYIDGYDQSMCWNWVKSLHRCNYTGHIVVIACRVRQETVDWLKSQGITVYTHEPMGAVAPVVTRFYVLWKLIEDKKINSFFVMMSDVKDIIFQTNLEKFLLTEDSIIVGTENVRYKDEPWGMNNLKSSFPSTYPTLSNFDIINAGSFTARTHLMMDICKLVFLLSINNRVPNPDQAALNVLLRSEPFAGKLRCCTVRDNYAIQIGTTFDPTKNLKQIIPLTGIRVRGGPISNPDGVPYTIVHQYDRNPEMIAYVKETYPNE